MGGISTFVLLHCCIFLKNEHIQFLKYLKGISTWGETHNSFLCGKRTEVMFTNMSEIAE